MIGHRIGIYGDAEGGSDFVLAAVEFSDGGGVVVDGVELLFEIVGEFAGPFYEFGLVFEEGEYGTLDGGQRVVKFEDGAGFFSVHGFFAVGIAEEGEGPAVGSSAGFDDIGGVMFAPDLVEIGERFSAVFAVLAKVVVGAVSDAFKLAPSDGELVFDIDASLGVVGEFVAGMVAKAQLFWPDAIAGIPVEPFLFPVLPPLHVGAFAGLDFITGFAEELQLHLFEFAGAEDEVPWGDFVAERLSDLGDAEGEFATHACSDVVVVDEDSLGGFGAHVDNAGAIGDGSYMGLKHEVEVTRFGEFAGAFGAGESLGQFGAENFDVHAFTAVEKSLALFGALPFFAGLSFVVGLYDEAAGGAIGALPGEQGKGGQVILAEALFAGFAIDERVGEVGDMAAGDPGGGVHEDGGIESFDIVALINHGAPPGFFDIAFEFDPDGSVIPGAAKSAVDLAALENDAAAFAERNDGIHGNGHGEGAFVGLNYRKRSGGPEKGFRKDKTLIPQGGRVFGQEFFWVGGMADFSQIVGFKTCP